MNTQRKKIWISDLYTPDLSPRSAVSSTCEHITQAFFSLKLLRCKRKLKVLIIPIPQGSFEIQMR